MNYKLDQIYFYLTEGCNLCCRHCYIAPKFQSDEITYPSLDLDLFYYIIEQGKTLGLRGVKLTGGEPLLHPQFLKMLDFIKKEELSLTIETNGILCTSEIARGVKKCVTPSVSVSLDGATPETHEYIRGVKGCFNATIQGIKNLTKEGLKPQIIMSIMETNKDEIEHVVKLAESLGASSVKFNLVQPTERGLKLHQSGDTLSIEELIEVGKQVETELVKTTNLRLFYSHPHVFSPLSSIFGEGGCSCGTCGIFGIIGVLADGSYALCGIGEIMKDLIFGHSRNDSLEDVWKHSNILNLIREKLPQGLEGICGDCLFKGICLGHCIAQTYYRTKNLFSPFWYCEEAMKKGLFPKHRLRNMSIY